MALPFPSVPPPFLDEKIALSMVTIKKKSRFLVIVVAEKISQKSRRDLKMKKGKDSWEEGLLFMSGCGGERMKLNE